MIATPNVAASTTYHVCIVGSGPAGITVALELERLQPEWRILLVEYGWPGMPANNGLDDSISIDNLVNHHPPEECTNKGLGGSSATWGGRCVMYDEADFLPRPVVGDDCTWDLQLFAEIKPYIGRAAEILECGSGPFDLNEDPRRASSRIADGFNPGDITDSVVERWSKPTRFGSSHRSYLVESRVISLLEGWCLDRFDGPEDGVVASATFKSSTSSEPLTISASHFVIAAGTQESTRILLRNPQVFSTLPEPPKALGRYYQGHVSGKIASVQFSGNPKHTDYGFIRDPDGVYLRRRFQFTAEAICRENLLNTALWLDNPLYFDPAHRSGAMSFMYLAMVTPILGKRLAPPAIAQSITKGKVTGVGSHLLNILKDFPRSLWTPASIFFRRYCLSRKLPGVFLYSPENRYALHFHAEQVPHADNRMELGVDGESLRIHYALTDADIDSVIRCHQLLDQWLQKCGCGKLEYWFPEQSLPEAIRKMSRDGIHQSGTTRIADSPEQGVVDRDTRVFGTKNLYVCSSSNFPTSGQANPTFFLCAFAVRLAHLLAKNEAD